MHIQVTTTSMPNKMKDCNSIDCDVYIKGPFIKYLLGGVELNDGSEYEIEINQK
jgi:hypothetical protein